MATQPEIAERGTASDNDMVSVIIAARNEEAYIGSCLRSVLRQDGEAGSVEVILAANACTDKTTDIAASLRPAFEDRGWPLKILDVPKPGKTNALNAGDTAARGAYLVFLDADVRLDAEMLGQLRRALCRDEPHYATGTLSVAPAKTWITRRYADLWQQLPFVQGGAVGAGLFAVNRAGRSRWGAFPDIISDDTFVRLQFHPSERIEVPALYHWPMVEGFRNLVRVRRRQDDGVRELHQLYLESPAREGKGKMTFGTLLGLILRRPVSFLVYATVHITVRLRRSQTDWARGR